jgi:hypothetical protein
MATGSAHEFLLRSWRMRRVAHLRSVKDGSKGGWAKLLGAVQSFACLLLLLITLRVAGQGLLRGVAGTALVLLLQEAVDPTPLFWTAPWEAMQLLLSRSRRVNHIWLHRTQELARESIGMSRKVDGFAMADGFVLIGVGCNKQLVRWTAEAAWRGIVRVRKRARHSRGCKALRFLIAVWLMAGILLAMSVWRGIDLPTVLLIAVFSGAAGHALAQPFENTLGRWLALPAWHHEDARTFCVEVEPVEFPEWLRWQGGQGFIVRRIPEEEARKG